MSVATVKEFIAPSKNKHRILPWDYAPYICFIRSVVYYWKISTLCNKYVSIKNKNSSLQNCRQSLGKQ